VHVRHIWGGVLEINYKYRISDVEYELLPMEQGIARGVITAMWEAWDEKGSSLGKGTVSRTFRADDPEFDSGYNGAQLKQLFDDEIRDGLDRLYTRKQMQSFLGRLFVDIMQEPESLKSVQEHEPSVQTKIWSNDSKNPIGFRLDEESK
jgi:hypothetical protein